MRQLMRLVRYVLPFLLQFLPGVFLLAAVGFLEAFRLVLLKPVLDRVLNPVIRFGKYSSSSRFLRHVNQSTFSISFLRTFTMPGPSWPMRLSPRRC